MSNKDQSVLIFGAGIAGLTAAQELAERGCKVTVIEKEKEVGGKARSFMLPGNRHKENLYPGEHGFRFFLHWYENLQDTLQRIPTENNKSVSDNLIAVDELLIDKYIFSFKKPEPVPIRPPLAWIKAMTACRQRHEEEFEATTWDKYIDDNLKGKEEQEVIAFFKNTPKATASVHCEEASVRALSYTLNRLLMNPGLDVLNGPTNAMWFKYWFDHLRNIGVTFQFETELVSIDIRDKEMISVKTRHKDTLTDRVADHYIAAIPFEKLTGVFTGAQLNQCGLENLPRLRSGWQAGIVLYLKERIHLPHGHFGFSFSTWALSGIQQSDFWTDAEIRRTITPNDHKAILSLIIADWDAPGDGIGKPARECTLEEIIEEIKFQLIKYAPPEYRNSFERMHILDYTIDPGIHLTGDKNAGNVTPLFMNTVNSWQDRPEARTAIGNFHIAGDFARTSAYLATMESANEAGRRAANSVFAAGKTTAKPCKIYTEKHNRVSKFLMPLQKIDESFYAFNQRHVLDYLDNTQAEKFITNLMPYLQFDGSMLQAADNLYDNILLLWTIINEQPAAISPEILDLIFPHKRTPFNTLAGQINLRAAEWAKVNMRMVDYMPEQFPDSLHSYIDTSNPIFKPLLHVTRQKGSAHRVQYAFALNEWYEAPASEISHLLETGQCIHNCSLLIDDVMDNTKIRRNAPAAHELFGSNQTLGAAYTTFFQILVSTYINLGEKCLMYYLEESARAHIGQTEEVYYRENKLCPTEDKYLEIIANKTGSFFRVFALCLSAMKGNKVSGDVDERILKLAGVIGLFFQIRDDYLDLTSEEYFQKKGTIASDLEEGKFSYPMVYCLQNHPEYEELFRTRLGSDISDPDKQYLLNILTITGSLDKTLEKITSLYAEAIDLVQDIDLSLRKKNKKLVEWLRLMAEHTPGLKTPAIQTTDRKDSRPVNKDPFEVSLLKYEGIVRAIRNVLSCRVVYFRLNGWREEEFWKCFPLLITVECMILNLDDQNETHEKDSPVITRDSIKKSRSWQLIAQSSFYTPEMDGILDAAIEYYRMEQEWYHHRAALLNTAAVKFMNHQKSTNFRILHLLSRNILNGHSTQELFFHLEDYVSVLLEEKEADNDSISNIYNVVLHSRALHKDAGTIYLTSYKELLFSALAKEQQCVIDDWLALYVKAGEYLVNKEACPPLRTGLKKIYDIARTIAGQCQADEELASFTVKGNFNWCIRRFFDEKDPFRSSDDILRRLQKDALLSLTKDSKNLNRFL